MLQFEQRRVAVLNIVYPSLWFFKHNLNLNLL